MCLISFEAADSLLTLFLIPYYIRLVPNSDSDTAIRAREIIGCKTIPPYGSEVLFKPTSSKPIGQLFKRKKRCRKQGHEHRVNGVPVEWVECSKSVARHVVRLVVMILMYFGHNFELWD
jgi:hypothetical protein